jgi:transposase
MSILYAGIDLHSNNSVLVISDERDVVIYEKRLKNDLKVILDVLSRYAEELVGIVVESTYNWYWLVDGLQAAGHTVHLANTVAIPQYSGLKYSDDKSDARWLARMLQFGLLPEAYIYPAKDRPTRDLLRRRRFLVEQRTSNILSIQNVYSRNTSNSLSARTIERLTPEQTLKMNLPELVVLSLNTSLEMVQCFTKQIKAIEKVAYKRVQLTDNFKNLTTVDGIGLILALTIMLETGDIRRFHSVGNYASYSRCVGGARISNGKKKGGVNTKNGNAYLSWAFSEAAHHAICHNSKIARFYQRKLAKNHMMVARRAVAHKLARVCYYILRDGVVFDENKGFGGR